MGTVTLNKNNRLYWLGRYAERVYQDVESIKTILDKSIDGEASGDLDILCKKIGVPNDFSSVEDFCSRFCFDRKIPESVLYSADAMLGNGMVLREVIGTQTLSYIQMAVIAIESAHESEAPGVPLQWALDDIMAFRGCYSEFVASQTVRNIIKSGASVERIGAMIRLGNKGEKLDYEIKKLVDRLKKSKLDHVKEYLEVIEKYARKEEGSDNEWLLLKAVESLFIV
ncbi:MAG: alpha-E domain-containing protein [Bacillota bacterium]